MERLSSTTINCGSRVLLQLSLFPTQNCSNRKRIRSQPKFMNQIPILLFFCILINSFYQIYSHPEIPNFSGKHNLTSPILSSLSIRKNASSKVSNRGPQSSSPSSIRSSFSNGKITANSNKPSEVKEHHSSSHSPSSSPAIPDIHKNAQGKSIKRTEHSTYSNKHSDRSESTKNNPNATVRGIREAGVEEKLEGEGGDGGSESGASESSGESSPNSATEAQSTTGSPTTGESGGQSTTGGTSAAGEGKETSKEGSDSTGGSSESSSESSTHSTGSQTTGGTSGGPSGDTSPAGEESKKTEKNDETSKPSEKTTPPPSTHTTTHKSKHGEKSTTASHEGHASHQGHEGHDGHHSTPSHPKHTTKKVPENHQEHHKTKEKRDNNTDTTWSPKYLKHSLVPKDEYVLSAELKTDKFDIHDWANKSGRLFERTVIHSAASNLKLDTKNIQMMLIYPTPNIFADKTIIRFSLKSNNGYVSGSEMDKFKNALQKALHEQLHIESITLSSGTGNNQKPFFQSGIYSLLILSMLGACLILILIMLIILIVILGHRTKGSSKPNKETYRSEGSPEFDSIKPNRMYQGNVNNGFEISGNEFIPPPPASRAGAPYNEGAVVPYNERFYPEANRRPEGHNTADTRL